jgi:hypothetical protein
MPFVAGPTVPVADGGRAAPRLDFVGAMEKRKM